MTLTRACGRNNLRIDGSTPTTRSTCSVAIASPSRLGRLTAIPIGQYAMLHGVDKVYQAGVSCTPTEVPCSFEDRGAVRNENPLVLLKQTLGGAG